MELQRCYPYGMTSIPPPPFDRSWTSQINIGDSLEKTRSKVRWESGESPNIRISNEKKWNHDRQRIEHRYMLYDYEKNLYIQEWRDIETGEVMFHKEGEIGDPRMHGVSARGGELAQPGTPSKSQGDTYQGPRIANIGFNEDGTQIIITYDRPL